MKDLPERFYVNMCIRSVFSLNKTKNFCLYFEVTSVDFNLEENVWIVKYQIYGPIEKIMKKKIWYPQIKLLYRKINTTTIPVINGKLDMGELDAVCYIYAREIFGGSTIFYNQAYIFL